MYGKRVFEQFKPKVTELTFERGVKIPIVTFSIKAAFLSLLMNKDLMHQDNLLLDPKDPFWIPPVQSNVLGDLNTGWWHRETATSLCLKPTDILLPIILFIDASNIDKNGKLSVEPVTLSLGIFNRATRNLAHAWRTIGFLENLAHTLDDDVNRSKSTRRKLQDNHAILDLILKEFKEMQGIDGGFEWKLDLGGKQYDVVFKIAIQVIIGDCKGHDVLCGRMGNHSEKTPGFCRDCNVSYDESDLSDHKCTYFVRDDFKNKSTKELNVIGFHNIDNCFHDVCFGARDLGIFGSTPSEPLHAFKLGLCKYLYEGFRIVCPPECRKKFMNPFVQKLAHSSKRQSIKDLPDLGVLRNGIDGCKTLTADEQYARVFGIYLALLDPIVFKAFAEKQRYKKDPDKKRPIPIGPMGFNLAKEWLDLCEMTIIYHSWLYATEHSLESLVTNEQRLTQRGETYWGVSINDDIVESDAMRGCRRYLQKFKDVVNRTDGNCLKLTKFHQQLHQVTEVLKDGSIQNIDGGRCESIAIYNSKNHGRVSQKRAKVMNWQIAQNILDDQVVADATRHYDRIIHDHSSSTSKVIQSPNLGSKFEIYLESDQRHDGRNRRTNVMIKWKGRKPQKILDKRMCDAIARRLYMNVGEGGCLRHTSKVKGFTEYKNDDHTYRSHPSFHGGTEWYDWVLVNWDHLTEPVPAKVCMFLDLQNSELMTNEEHQRFRAMMRNENPRNANNDDVYMPNTYKYLDRSKWMVVQCSLAVDDEGVRINDEYRLSSKLGRRLYLEQQWRILPVESIEGPAFCVEVGSTVNDESESEDIVCLESKSSWKRFFLCRG